MTDARAPFSRAFSLNLDDLRRMIETPPGPYDIDAARERVERVAQLMDTAVRIPGTNIGVGADALIGLIPGVGNLATTLVSAFIVYEARRLGVSRFTLLRMAGNVGLDALVSSVPVLGNVADVFFRSNRRNVELLRRHFDEAAARARPVR
jgi:hypothetical protein